MPLATIERIESVWAHPNADKLDFVRVLGYDCIVGRGAYLPGDVVVLIQPDTVLPADQAWAAASLKYTSRGRVKAARLRGLWSMGLVMPLEILGSNLEDEWRITGVEVGAVLGIVPYEAPPPRDIKAKGGLPFGIPKTDEDRWQNVRNLGDYLGEPVDVTLKIDGSSFTAFCVLPGDHTGAFCSPRVEEPVTGVTSRTLELKTDIEGTNHWLEAARLTNVQERLAAYCMEHGVSLALRGEVYGPGVQSLAVNPHCREPRGVAFFSAWNVQEHRYEGREDEHYFRRVCEALDLPTVPILETGVPLTRDLLTKYGDELEEIDGRPFEGVVLKGSDFSMKVVNKAYDARK